MSVGLIWGDDKVNSRIFQLLSEHVDHLIADHNSLNKLFICLSDVTLLQELFSFDKALVSLFFTVLIDPVFHLKLSAIKDQNAFDSIDLEHS